MTDDIQLPRDREAELEYLGRYFAKPADAGDLLALNVPDHALEADPLHVAIHKELRTQHLHGGISIPLLRARLKPPASTHDLSRDYFDDLADFAPSFASAEYAASRIVELSRKRQRYDTLQTLAQHSLNGYSSEQIDRAVEAELYDWRREREIAQPPLKTSFADLRNQHPQLKPVLIDGLLRLGETANFISYSKVGKSWGMYGLALSIITGRLWLGRYPTTQGKVLFADNELHRETFAHRVPAVGDAMGIPASEYENELDVISLRGNLRSLDDLACELADFEPGEYKAIILDAKYRFAVAGVSENDNAAETAVYNTLDRMAEKTQAAIILVHHASKGSQTDKRVTDVGAGAGAQSRAADCHIVLREHDEPGVVVLEAAVRSFAPVEPLALRWAFPLWVPANDIDPTQLKGRKTKADEQQSEKDRDGIEATLTALASGPATPRQLRRLTGMGEYRQSRLLDLMVSQGSIEVIKVKVGKVSHEEYQLKD